MFKSLQRNEEMNRSYLSNAEIPSPASSSTQPVPQAASAAPLQPQNQKHGVIFICRYLSVPADEDRAGEKNAAESQRLSLHIRPWNTDFLRLMSAQ